MSNSPYKIFLALPSGGTYLPCCISGIIGASAKHPVAAKPQQFGDIPHNFNMLFCEALGARAQGITHFAMLHSDIMVEGPWVDVLIEEMDRVNADIMSAVVSIKDFRGLSTAGVRVPGNWQTGLQGSLTRRFTFRELYRLPETFSIADTDQPDQILAINTGCWVCRFPQNGWPDKFPGFQNEHRIVWNGGDPEPWFDSEDWIFSAWAHEQGLRVFTTRKVKTAHQGSYFYVNDHSWGTWETELQRPTRPLVEPLPDPAITIETDHPIALDSLDHTNPLGARVDNTFSHAFNHKLFEVCPIEELRLLDLGCSGGGFVRSILDAGAFAIGIEGSDFSKIRKRAEWEHIPKHLFTADATRRFTIRNCQDGPAKFNLFTGWEFWEHIPEDRISAVIANIEGHASPGAIFIGSISSNAEPHHCTAKPRDWWIEKLGKYGWTFEQTGVDHFGDDLVRGGANPNGISFSVVFRISPQTVESMPEPCLSAP